MRQEEMTSDEELLQFIADVEENDMVEAPSYLKEQIIFEAQNWQRKNIRRQYRAFEFKVWLATAAALAVILLIPTEIRVTEPIKKSVPMTKEEYLEREKNSFSNSVDRFVDKMIGKLSLKEDNRNEEREKE